MSERTGAERECPCGATFYAAAWQLRSGKGRYCSNACKFRFRKRPSGLTYQIRVKNRAWIVPGQRLSPKTEFQPGEIPHNWKGDAVGYAALHDWVRRYRGRPERCEHCGGFEDLQWANKSFEYRRSLDDWLSLCYRCHRTYDRAGVWGAATRKFPELQRARKRRRKVHQ